MSYGSSKLYRHGVLVGNWHEDQKGLELVANPSINYNPNSHYMTETTTHYRPPGPEALIENYMQKQRTAQLNGVNGSQLFRHTGADTYESRYLTTYSTANHPIVMHTTKRAMMASQRSTASLLPPVSPGRTAAGGGARPSVSAGGQRSSVAAAAAAAASSGSPTNNGSSSARSPSKSPSAAGGEAAPAQPKAAKSASVDVIAADGVLTEVNTSYVPSAPFDTIRTKSDAASIAAVTRLFASGSTRLASTKAGKNKPVPTQMVTPESVRAGDLSVEYSQFAMGGRRRPFPTVPDPSLNLERMEQKINVWRAERDGLLRTRTYESEHAASFQTPASKATASTSIFAASNGGGGADGLSLNGTAIGVGGINGIAAGSKTSQVLRDARGVPKTQHRKHQQFKVHHDANALKLRS